MKITSIISLITLIILSACNKENTDDTLFEDINISIKGTAMSDFSSKSRATTIYYLTEYDSINIYSTGGIIANGDTLKYKNGEWTGLKNDKWETNGKDATVCAFFPMLNEQENNIYDNKGELIDIIYYKENVEFGNSVNLSFKHLFAKFKIDIDSKLNDTIKSVDINIPVTVENINPYTAEVALKDSNSNISFSKNDNGLYETFVPTDNYMDISITIETESGYKHHLTAGNRIYNSGHEYTCNINLDKGIYTNEDFIAFTYLLNGIEDYDGKNLNEFYVESENGVKTYKLMNDLYFTDEESKLLQGIGIDTPFNDTFDGNGYTLYNININVSKKSSYLGLFDTVGENGCIKNLTLDGCKLIESKDIKMRASNGAFMVGQNNGLIDNCHIKNGIITTYSENNSSRIFSGLCSSNNGYLINSSVGGLTITHNGDKKATVNFVNFTNNGHIINMFVKPITRISSNTPSSIISRTNDGKVYNVFINNYLSKYYISYTNKKNINNCIIPAQFEDNNYIIYDGNRSGFITYSTSQEEYTEEMNLLNNWIDTEGKTLFPEFKFRRWIIDPTDKVMFE